MEDCTRRGDKSGWRVREVESGRGRGGNENLRKGGGGRGRIKILYTGRMVESERWLKEIGG